MSPEMSPSVDREVASIELRRVTRQFKSATGLEDVSFSVRPGETYCLLGSAGAGKTTVVNLLLGLDAPTSGQVWVSGERVAAGNPHCRREVTFVSGDCTLCPAMTAMQNVKLFATVGNPRIRWSEKGGRDALRTMGVADRLFDTRLARLAPENVTQVWLAVAWLRSSRILILDEPTLFLDPYSAARLQRHLARFREAGCALLVATADLLFASQLADRLGILTRGRKTAERTRAEVLSSSLTELYVDYLGQAPDRASLDHPTASTRMPM
jgi:ABC-2 type transport system ATP-binding protein